MSEFVNLPSITITKDLIDRVQFSLSSRNAENKVAECSVHVFASRLSENLQEIQWQYVASGVPCMLRNRELHKNGRKYMWSMSVCLYNAHYGVLVWKSKLSPNCEYTTVADNFHVFALSEVNVIVGLLFSSKEQACELNTLYNTWHQERQRDDGKKGPTSNAVGVQQTRYKKEMISKPCNFQHIQGTQALDECLEIEKIKADIIAALFGLGTSAGRSEPDGQATKRKGSQSKKSKHEISKPKMTFKMLNIPRTSMNTPPPTSPPLTPLATTSEASSAHEQLHTAHTVQFQATVDVVNGYQDNSDTFVPPEATMPPDATFQSEATMPPEAAVLPDPVVSMTPEAITPPLEPSHPSIVTTDFAETGTGEFIPDELESAGNSQGSQPPPAYDQVSPDTNEDYDRLDPNVGVQYNTSQGSLGYGQSPPRLDLNLEKEFTESVLFQSPLMTAN